MQQLRQVLWIGGAPGAGKSSVATRLARRYGLRWYGADTRTWQHRDRALRAGNAAARRWEAMTPRQRWVGSTPAEMLEMSLHTERGPMVVDDLRALPDSPLVVAEGTTLPAYVLSRGIAERSRAVWLMPTREFQRATLAGRGVAPGPTRGDTVRAPGTAARSEPDDRVPDSRLLRSPLGQRGCRDRGLRSHLRVC